MRKTIHPIAIVLVATVVALTVGSSAIAGEETEKTCLKCRVKVLLKEHAKGDVEKAMSYLADDFMRIRVDTGETLSRSEVRSRFEWDAALNGKIEPESLAWEGSKVNAVFSETNDLFAHLGLEPRKYRATFLFDGDLIRKQWIQPMPRSGPAIEEALAPCLAWASGRHADLLTEIYPEGRFAYSADAALRWVELLSEWKSERAGAGAS